MMMAWWLGVFRPAAGLAGRGAAALAVCFAVESSQLFHGPLIDGVRDTTAGRLVLGSGFDPRDFLSYTIGVLAAVALEWLATRSSARAG